MRRREVVVSADVCPDLIRPWHHPTTLILYAKRAIVTGDIGLVEAQGRHDANVIVRTPDDRSVFPAHDFV